MHYEQKMDEMMVEIYHFRQGSPSGKKTDRKKKSKVDIDMYRRSSFRLVSLSSSCITFKSLSTQEAHKNENERFVTFSSWPLTHKFTLIKKKNNTILFFLQSYAIGQYIIVHNDSANKKKIKNKRRYQENKESIK